MVAKPGSVIGPALASVSAQPPSGRAKVSRDFFFGKVDRTTSSSVYRHQIFWLEIKKDGVDLTPSEIEKFDLIPTIMLPNVSSVSMNRAMPIHFQWTIGTDPAIHHSANASFEATISGRISVDNIFDMVRQRRIDPGDYIKHLKQFFESFSMAASYWAKQNIALSDPTVGLGSDGIRMILRSQYDEWNHYVIPTVYSIRRGGATKFGVEYEVALKAYGKSLVKAQQWITDPALAVQGPWDHINRVSGAIATFRQHARRHVQGHANRVLMGITASTLGIFDQLGRIGELPADFVTQKRGWIRNALSAASITISRFEQAYAGMPWQEQLEIKGAGDGVAGTYLSGDVLASRAVISKIHRSLLVIIMNSGGIGMLKDDPSPVHGSVEQVPFIGSGSDVMNQVGYVWGDEWGGSTEPYVVIEGDTLESIAWKELGSKDAWTTLAFINLMPNKDFYFDGRPLTPGDILNIPVPSIGEQALSVDSRYPLGVDLEIGADGDLVATGTNTDSVALVYGPDSLKQGLTHRMMVKKGDSLVFPRFGLSVGPGDPSLFITTGAHVIDVKEQLLADPRVGRVLSAISLDHGDVLVVNSVVRVSDGNMLKLVTPLV